MFEFVWEFVVKEEARGQFELVYGPGGAWGKLFARCPGYRGTTVLRNTENNQRYLTIDLWKTEDQREQALGELKAEYSDLEAAFDKWTESRTEVGTFSVLAEATVRPRGRAGRSKTREVRRNSR